MRATPQILRRSFLAGAAALAATAACSDGRPTRPRERRPNRLPQRGVNYNVGGADERLVWRREFVEREIRAIREDLHANALILVGSDVGRFVEAAEIAADQGLYVWFEPRQFDQPAPVVLDFLSEVAGAAEDVRAGHADVGVSVGVELSIFLPGILPGDDFMERGAALERPDSAGYHDRLNAFLADAIATTRGRFGGQVTYSSGPWEQVEWADFDVVGVDLYRDAGNEATYARDVRRLHRHRKPVIITEFGCCSYRGAADRGGEGFMVAEPGEPAPPDWPARAELVRDEQVQADYLDEVLDVLEAERVHGGFVWNFIEPESTYSPDGRYDYDMSGYAIVTCHGADAERPYETTGHWEPKAAFDTLARRWVRRA